jgi:hypothetical protein
VVRAAAAISSAPGMQALSSAALYGSGASRPATIVMGASRASKAFSCTGLVSSVSTLVSRCVRACVRKKVGSTK